MQNIVTETVGILETIDYVGALSGHYISNMQNGPQNQIPLCQNPAEQWTGSQIFIGGFTDS